MTAATTARSKRLLAIAVTIGCAVVALIALRSGGEGGAGPDPARVADLEVPADRPSRGSAALTTGEQERVPVVGAPAIDAPGRAADLVVARSRETGEPLPFKSLKTDDYAYFLEFEGKAPPTDEVPASSLRGHLVWVSAAGYVPRLLDLRASLDALPFQEGRYWIDLAPRHRLVLRVLDEEGSPIPWSDLWASTASLDRATQFALSKGHHLRRGRDRRGPPAHRLQKPYAAEWLGQADEAGELSVDPLPRGAALDLLVTADGFLSARSHVLLEGEAAESPVEVRLRRAQAVVVSVTEEDSGAAVEGAEIWVISRHESLSVGTTDVEGTLRVSPRVPTPYLVECRAGGSHRAAVPERADGEDVHVCVVVPILHEVTVDIVGHLPPWIRGERWVCRAKHSSGSIAETRVRSRPTLSLSLPSGRNEIVVKDWRGLVVAEGTVMAPADRVELASAFSAEGLRIRLNEAPNPVRGLDLFATLHGGEVVQVAGQQDAGGAFAFRGVDQFVQDPVLRAVSAGGGATYLCADDLVAPMVNRTLSAAKFGFAELVARGPIPVLRTPTVLLRSPYFGERRTSLPELVAGVRVEPGPWRIEWETERGTARQVDLRAVQGRRSTVELADERATSDLTVRVEDHSGDSGWPFVHVEAVAAPLAGGAPRTWVGTTGPDGTVVLPQVDHGTLLLRTWGAFHAATSGFTHEHRGDEVARIRVLDLALSAEDPTLSKVVVLQSGDPVAALNAYALDGAGLVVEALPIVDDGALLVARARKTAASHFLIEQATGAAGLTIVERGVSVARAAGSGATVGMARAFLDGPPGRYSLRIDEAGGTDLRAFFPESPPLVMFSDPTSGAYWGGFHGDDLVSLVDLEDGRVVGQWRGQAIDGQSLPPRN